VALMLLQELIIRRAAAGIRFIKNFFKQFMIDNLILHALVTYECSRHVRSGMYDKFFQFNFVVNLRPWAICGAICLFG
jgi:hypothetical protein